jgi:hypothetical protein
MVYPSCFFAIEMPVPSEYGIPCEQKTSGIFEKQPNPRNGHFSYIHTAEGMHINLREVILMGTCEVCGNEYDKPFEVSMAGATHTFDSFECAIHALAPTCNHCSCRIMGHGVEGKTGVMFCSANCAKQEGVGDLRDRVA